MHRPRRDLKANGWNEFDGSKAGAFLRTLGWGSSDLGRLDKVAAPANAATIDAAVNSEPIVISTAFGPEPWGTTGAGHMIVVLGRSPSNRGEYVVYDPAGNYFSSPTNHYGPGSCGHAVLYPASWLLAYTTGAWYLKLGPPGPRPPRSSTHQSRLHRPHAQG